MKEKFVNHVRGRRVSESARENYASDVVKLTDTVYKILEYFPESDPLKNKAKDKALAIMSGEGLVKEDIETFLGYLRIGKSKGWISSANFFIIANEYEKIKKSTQTNSAPVLVPEGVQERDAPSFLLSDRQKKIIDFLTENGKGQVADFQTVLLNVTKRTIRRDLDNLLEAGKISRFGEFNQVFYQIKR